jgi:hypothetical protein
VAPIALDCPTRSVELGPGPRARSTRAAQTQPRNVVARPLIVTVRAAAKGHHKLLDVAVSAERTTPRLRGSLVRLLKWRALVADRHVHPRWASRGEDQGSGYAREPDQAARADNRRTRTVQPFRAESASVW